MTQFSTSIKSLCLVGLLAVAYVSVQGCSSDPPKNGVAVQADDYTHAPGAGKAKPGQPPNK